MSNTTSPGRKLRPVAVAEPLPLQLEMTEDQAVERILELDRREETTVFDVALETGDIVCQFVRADDAIDPKGTLARIAERTNKALSTLKTRGLVAERIPSEVRAHPNFRSCGSWTVFEEIGLSEASKRAELFDMVLNSPAPADARNGRWRVNDIRALMGRTLATNWVAPATEEERKATLIALLADSALLKDVVNDRQDGAASVAERAFFEARAEYVVEMHEQYLNGRETARRITEESALGMPSMTNISFLGRATRRIERDGQSYIDLAEALASPMLQQQRHWLAEIGPALDFLEGAIARVRATLPDAPVPEDDDSMTIDAEARRAVERFALPSFNYDLEDDDEED